MVFIYTLIILFALLLIYQFYSYDIIEGIDQAEIDKINSKLTELVKEVREITGGTLVAQLKSDVDTSKNNFGMLNSEFQFYRENKDNINQMILVSSELLNAKNDAIKSLVFDDSQNVPEMPNQTPNFGGINSNKFQNIADTIKEQQQNQVPFPTTSNSTSKIQNMVDAIKEQQQQQQNQPPVQTTSNPTHSSRSGKFKFGK